MSHIKYCTAVDTLFCSTAQRHLTKERQVRKGTQMDKETLQKQKDKKVLIGIVAASVLLLGLIFGSIAIAGNSPGRRADKYLELGNKYLSELDYEQALVAYRQPTPEPEQYIEEMFAFKNEYESYDSWNYDIDYRGYYVDGFTFWNYGSRMVFLVGEKNVLIDFARNTNGPDGRLDPDEIVLAVYDYIGMADEKYWLVQSGEKWGYIDHEGNEMAMFEDAGAFRDGYALVVEDGEAWLIDESFQKLQKLGAADGVSTAGEIYVVQSDDKLHFYHLIKQ